MVADEPTAPSRSSGPADPSAPELASGRLVVVVPTLDEAAALPALLGRLVGAGSVPSDGPTASWHDLADLLVVADGGSTDGTRRLAKDAGAEVLDAPPGRGHQLRAGGERALELLGEPSPDDLLLFLHADNLPEPGALAALRSAAATSGTEAFALSQRIDAPGRFFRLVERAADRRVARGEVLGDSGLAVRATAYRAVGGYAPLPLFEDLDLSKRLARRSGIQVVEDARLSVCARRWKREGALRATLRNRILTLAWRLGVSPERLVRWYPRHRAERPDHADRP